jgi:hypothetical protein
MEKILRRLGPIDQRIVVLGHSHRPDLVRLPNGTTVVNPGSVGCPAYQDPTGQAHVSESGTPQARTPQPTFQRSAPIAPARTRHTNNFFILHLSRIDTAVSAIQTYPAGKAGSDS